MIGALLFAVVCGFVGGVIAEGIWRWNKVQKAYEDGRRWGRTQAVKNILDSQSRLIDALEAKNERLERIAAQETLGANATVKRMAAIARGEA